MKLIEAAIAPRSHLAHQTLQEIRFEQKFGARVLAVWRRGRSIRTRLADLPLEFGDGLLLQGTEKSLTLLRTEPGLILLAESAPSTRMTLRGWFTTLIMAVTLTLAVIFPDQIAEIMLSGAVAMVLIRTLSMDQAYRAIDWRSLFLVAGMLPVGVALNKTGASTMFANAILSSFGGAGHLVLLAGFVLLTVALTQVINGAAAVTVVAPIAIVAAQAGWNGAEKRCNGCGAGIIHGVYVAARTFGQCDGDGRGRIYFSRLCPRGHPFDHSCLSSFLLVILPLIMPIG